MNKSKLSWKIHKKLETTDRQIDLVVGQQYDHMNEGIVTLERITFKPKFTVKSRFFFWSVVVPNYELGVVISERSSGLISHRVSWRTMTYFLDGLLEYVRFKRDLALAAEETTNTDQVLTKNDGNLLIKSRNLVRYFITLSNNFNDLCWHLSCIKYCISNN